MSKARPKRLGDILNFKRGYDLPSHKRVDGIYPVISSSGISGFHDEYMVSGQGVITGRYGTLGQAYFVDGDYWPHNTALYVTDFKGNHPKYVYYLMKCLGNLKTSDKSTVPGVNRNDLHEISVPYINPDYQEPIADVLSTLDAKIELNNRINAELEAMAKTLYDYWFVQFDFPYDFEKGKPDPKGKPYKSSGGKMVYNKTLKRKIPEGWEDGSILSVSDLFGGGTPSKDNDRYWNGCFPFFTPSDAKRDVYKFVTEDSITEEGLKNSSTRLFDKNTIFITARGSVGKLNLAGTRMGMNQSCYALKVKDKVSYTFLFYLTKELICHLDVKASGSVFNSIVSNDIKFTTLCIPDSIVIKVFANLVEPAFEQIAKNTIENQQLSLLRDWLLPMLMNGQVSVG